MANFEVIDADGHITEEDGQLKKYMEARYVNRAATLTPRDSWDRSLGGTLGTRAKDARSWLAAMDKGNIATAVLYPTNGLSVGWIREPDVAVAYSKAWNDFCSEEFQKVSPRLKCVALVPFQDVPEAVKELRRAVKELKLVGLMLPAVGLAGVLVRKRHTVSVVETFGTHETIHTPCALPRSKKREKSAHFGSKSLAGKG